MRPVIVCAVKPTPVIRTLLEVYYRVMDYRVVYVCPARDAMSWLTDGTLCPGSWHNSLPEAWTSLCAGEPKFALVSSEGDAAWCSVRGVPSLVYWEAVC